MSLATQALHLANRLRYTRGIAQAHMRAGQAYWLMGAFDTALQCFERGVVAARRAHDRATESRCVNGMGVSHDRMGRYDAALLCFERFGELIDPVADLRGAVMLAVNVGHVLERSGHHDQAIARYRKTLAMLGDATVPGKPMLHLNLGVCLALLKHHGDAALCMQAALDGFMAEGNQPNAVLSMLNLAETHWELDRRASALDLAQRARTQADALKVPPLGWRSMIINGLLLRKAGRLAASQTLLEQALAFERRCEEEELRRLNHDVLADTLQARRRYQAALAHYKIAKELELKAVRESFQRPAQAAASIGLEETRAVLRGRSRGASPGAARSRGPITGSPRPRKAGTLSGREAEVMQMLVEGMTNRAIGDALGISAFTVRYHVSSIFNKLGATKRSEAVARALRDGIVAMTKR